MKRFVKRLTDWTHWPFSLFYFPIYFAWLWYIIRSRSLWFYTAANPTITFGGFEGESKSELYRQLPPELCPRSLCIQPTTSFPEVLQQVQQHQLTFPLVVKPDVGMKGILFRKIEGVQQLQKYHQQMPVSYLVQEYIHLPNEISIFYCRRPHAEKGMITALIQKELFKVTGDGVSTVVQLIQEQHPTAGGLPAIKQQLGPKLQEVPAPGESFYLSHVANLVYGARFTDLRHLIDDQLLAFFDRISHSNQFYYGRYDIKCASVEDVKQGKNFVILEFNGAGSVPNHIFAGKYRLGQAYKEVLRHWKMLYEISRYNHHHGCPHYSFIKGCRFIYRSMRHFRVLRQLNKALSLGA